MLLLARAVGPKGRVCGIDISEEMLRLARRKVSTAGLEAMCTFTLGDAEHLAIADASFDAATVGFGIRNTIHPEKALREICRVLRPGGRLSVLEFSWSRSAFAQRLYDLYSFTLMPWVGRLVARHTDAYLYLQASIRDWPDQDAFATMMGQAGFVRVRYRNLCTGIVAIHVGIRPGLADQQG